MIGNISDAPTADLINRIISDDSDSDLTYEATWLLIERWRRRVDLDALVGLMQSDKTIERLHAAYTLEELSANITEIYDSVIKFADDPLPSCRLAFVSYCLNARIYDSSIANAMARCLLDTSLNVRLFSIDWAIRVPDAIFDDFSRRIQGGAGIADWDADIYDAERIESWRNASLRRSNRALEIARRVRSGEKFHEFRPLLKEEDSFVLDGLASMPVRVGL